MSPIRATRAGNFKKKSRHSNSGTEKCSYKFKQKKVGTHKRVCSSGDASFLNEPLNVKTFSSSFCDSFARSLISLKVVLYKSEQSALNLHQFNSVLHQRNQVKTSK